MADDAGCYPLGGCPSVVIQLGGHRFLIGTVHDLWRALHRRVGYREGRPGGDAVLDSEPDLISAARW